ncbi:glycosyltransferase [Thioalkalivibrio sp. ALJ15]|uniref:glycosyltransferase n=1 Tax=Thioalkalivibrio sp. ALJ15 TaxID=748652 RepID=UPI00036DE23C|nr:glycosyltransferase [Thioalkalivibrio sp. ALJ15]
MHDATCLHIVRNPVSHDSRVLKETCAVGESGLFDKLEIAGFHEAGFAEAEDLDGRTIHRVRLTSRPLPKDLLSQSVKYAEWYARLVSRYRRQSLRVIHCHNLWPLSIGVLLKRLTGAKLIYDAHELQTETVGNGGLRQKMARRAERFLMPRVDAMITVSPSIKDWYQKRYPKKSIHLVRNIPKVPDSLTNIVPLREQFSVPKNALLFLHLGGLSEGRGIEATLDAFQRPEVPHHILFMGAGPLAARVKEAEQRCARVHHREPVPPAEVLAHVAGADVGVSLYEDTCLNHRYCLPNKLFESLLAGIPVVVSDLPDQAAIVRERQAGWVVSPTADSIAERLASLSSEEGRVVRKKLPERVADLRWQTEENTLISVYRKLLSVST